MERLSKYDLHNLVTGELIGSVWASDGDDAMEVYRKEFPQAQHYEARAEEAED